MSSSIFVLVHLANIRLAGSYWTVVNCEAGYALKKQYSSLRTKACLRATNPVSVWGDAAGEWIAEEIIECIEIVCPLEPAFTLTPSVGMEWDHSFSGACTDQNCNGSGCKSGERCRVRCKSGYGFSAATSQAYSDPDNVETSTCPGTDGLTHENDPNRKVMWENGAPSCTPIKCTIPELPAAPSGKYMYTHDVSASGNVLCQTNTDINSGEFCLLECTGGWVLTNKQYKPTIKPSRHESDLCPETGNLHMFWAGSPGQAHQSVKKSFARLSQLLHLHHRLAWSGITVSVALAQIKIVMVLVANPARGVG